MNIFSKDTPQNHDINTKAKNVCPKCGGRGFIINSDDTVDICECVGSSKSLILKTMNIPKRFWYVMQNLDSFDFGKIDKSYEGAYVTILNYVAEFPQNNGEGLLFVGRPGVGKTHLAIFTLLYIEQKHKIRGLFYDTKSLILDLKTLINNNHNQEYNMLLRKVINTPILVLDDLGSETLTDYNKDIITHIIYSRYNQLKPIIITTNLELDKSALPKENIQPKNIGDRVIPAQKDSFVYDFSAVSNVIGSDLTLRLGDNITSRISEMCRVIYLAGEDRRRMKAKREVNY